MKMCLPSAWLIAFLQQNSKNHPWPGTAQMYLTMNKFCLLVNSGQLTVSKKTRIATAVISPAAAMKQGIIPSTPSSPVSALKCLGLTILALTPEKVSCFHLSHVSV